MVLNLRIGAARSSAALFLPLVLCVCRASEEAVHRGASAPHVGVVVRNFSGAPVRMIEDAEAACRKIFELAEIRITWWNTVAGRSQESTRGSRLSK
jgi:hypothetical protein